MAETPDQAPSSARTLKLESAHIDLNSVRTQIVIGTFLILAGCILSDSPNLYNLNFALHALLAFLVGLISLEISGLYGNRLGAIPAVWSSLLLSLYPACAATGGHLNKSTLCTIFFLISFLAYQRFRLLKEWTYLAAAVICFLLSLANGYTALILLLLITLYELLFRNSPAFISNLETINSDKIQQNAPNPNLVAISLLLLGTVWLGLTMISHMAIPAVSRTVSTLSNFSMPIAVFCIFFPLLALPIAGVGNRRQNRAATIIGLILLSIAAYGFHNLHGQFLF